MSFLTIDDLHVSYKREDKKRAYAVQGLSIELGRQETLGIVGETGAGKTTTALSIMGLLPSRGRVDAGSVKLDGIELIGLNDTTMRSIRGAKMAMIFQNPMSSLNPTMTIEQQVAEGILLHTFDRESRVKVSRRVDELLTVALEDVAELVERQAAYNTAIAEEGLRGNWGATIGSVLLKEHPEDISCEAKAWAAAGSDARMSGCEMPVVILSGSGNQGITASVPVVRYAEHIGASREKLCRALLVSDLVTIHIKSGIGRLSAYCGAVGAGVGAGAGIAYLLAGDYETIAHTIVNAVAILSGTICDGAKPSCAAKIAASVEAGILGYHMYKNGQEFKGGDGIVTKGVDNTIANIGVLAKEGMRETDHTILSIMTQRCD